MKTHVGPYAVTYSLTDHSGKSLFNLLDDMDIDVIRTEILEGYMSGEMESRTFDNGEPTDAVATLRWEADPDYSLCSTKEFNKLFLKFIRKTTVDEILLAPGVPEILMETYNNDVLNVWFEKERKKMEE